MLSDGKPKSNVADLRSLTQHMMFERKQKAGKTLLLQHKLIEVIRAAPRFVAEYLKVEYEQKTIDKWSNLIFKSITPCSNLALLPTKTQQELASDHMK